MASYRSKPTTVEAVQFDPAGEHRLTLPPGVEGMAGPGADNWGYQGCQFWVRTIQGERVQVRAGEWIITEPDGVHHYPCADEVFRARYDPIPPPRPYTVETNGLKCRHCGVPMPSPWNYCPGLPMGGPCEATPAP